MATSPLDRRLDDLRQAYLSVPVGDVISEGVADAMPSLTQAVEAVLRETGRICDACGKDHSRATAGDVEHDDFAAILRALDLDDHARPTSRHRIVHEEILPAIGRLGVREYHLHVDGQPHAFDPEAVR